MSSTRVKKLGGIYKTTDFLKIVRQLNGRAVLVVAIVNSTCDECAKILKFIHQLEGGFIEKVPQLVMVYGMSNQKLLTDRNSKESKPVVQNEGEEEKRENNENSRAGSNKNEKKALGDSRFLIWEGLPEHHGYAIFLNHKDVLYYRDSLNHDDFVSNIIDNIRRFNSSLRTLEGLSGKRTFLKNKRTGIIVETNSSTPQSTIMEIEAKVKSFEGKLPTSVYFCKGIAQEMSLVRYGEVIIRKKGLKLEKFLRKIAKSNISE